MGLLQLYADRVGKQALLCERGYTSLRNGAREIKVIECWRLKHEQALS